MCLIFKDVASIVQLKTKSIFSFFYHSLQQYGISSCSEMHRLLQSKLK